MRKIKSLAPLFLLAVFAGCSSQSSQPAPKPQPAPPELQTGRPIFQQLYIAAHGWARDVQPFRLQSQVTAGSKDRDGKSSVWTCFFASPSQSASKSYTWSGTDAADAPQRGILPGGLDSYSPSNSSTAVFDIRYLKIDSDQAYQVAQKHGGDKVLAKDPGLPVTYILDWNGPSNELIWHVIYGASRGDSKLTIDVDATSAAFVRTEK